MANCNGVMAERPPKATTISPGGPALTFPPGGRPYSSRPGAQRGPKRGKSFSSSSFVLSILHRTEQIRLRNAALRVTTQRGNTESRHRPTMLPVMASLMAGL